MKEGDTVIVKNIGPTIGGLVDKYMLLFALLQFTASIAVGMSLVAGSLTLGLWEEDWFMVPASQTAHLTVVALSILSSTLTLVMIHRMKGHITTSLLSLLLPPKVLPPPSKPYLVDWTKDQQHR